MIYLRSLGVNLLGGTFLAKNLFQQITFKLTESSELIHGLFWGMVVSAMGPFSYDIRLGVGIFDFFCLLDWI